MTDISARGPDSSRMLESERPWTAGQGLLWLWSGLLLAPLGWVIHLNASYGLATLACGASRWWLVGATVLSLTAAAAGGYFAWRTSTMLGRGDVHDGSVIGRSRFMGMAGLWLSAFFAAVILVQSVPQIFLTPCE